MRKLLLLVLLVLLALPEGGRAGIGDVDVTWGEQGRVDGFILPLEDGRALVPVEGGYGRLDTAGRLDATFAASGTQAWPLDFRPNWTAWLRMPDGTRLLGGSSGTRAALVHLDAAGALDSAFAGGGILLFDPVLARSRVEDLALAPDGAVLVLAGEYYAAIYFDAPVQVFVRRLHPSGQADAGFGTGGMALVADYRDGEWYHDAYAQHIDVLWNGRIRYTDDLPPVLPPGIRTHHRYLTEGGLPASSPGPVFAAPPDPDPPVKEWHLLRQFPDGGRLVLGMPAAAAPGLFIACRLDANGHGVSSFGDSGCLEVADVEKGSETFAAHVTAGGQWLYVARAGEDSTVVTRIRLDGASAGTPDDTFGDAGRVRLGFRAQPVSLHGTDDGALLLQTHRGTWRLLANDLPSPGIVSLVTEQAYVGPGMHQVRVTRSAGSDGSAAVDFRAVEFPYERSRIPAAAGVDFKAADERLAWEDGDAGDKVVAVQVLTSFMDAPAYQYKAFALVLEDPQDALVGIARSDWMKDSSWIPPAKPPTPPPAPPPSTPPPPASTSPPPPPSPSPAGTGGSGPIDPSTLLGLGVIGGLVAARRRRT